MLHDKEIDLVCIDHRVGICTNCALFGEHKNHNIKTVKSVMEECAVIAEQTIAIVTEIEVKYLIFRIFRILDRSKHSKIKYK